VTATNATDHPVLEYVIAEALYTSGTDCTGPDWETVSQIPGHHAAQSARWNARAVIWALAAHPNLVAEFLDTARAEAPR
jgi:hypothetical protein